ncbi:MAG TPA: TetR/AcrR family transcriptional regulator [Bryobacteraceae bacterium]|nr:TetR/AcrR family transcriptional regulator [Bryobacteraceae bacterium]
MGTRMTGAERRAAIVDAAIHLFAEKGFRGATTRGLASALGVSGPMLYRHFKTKEDLYRAIIETKSQQDDEQLAGLALLEEAGDDRAFFRYMGTRMLARYDEDPDFMRLLLFSALERHEMADLFFERQMLQYFTIVSRYIQSRIDSGRFRRMDAAIAARGFNGMVIYHGLMRLLFGTRVIGRSREDLVNEMVETFLHGVCRNPA